MIETIRRLVETFGPSGHEEKVRALIRSWVADVADDVRTDAMGNLMVLRKGNGSGKRLMMSAHTDEIGVMVSFIDEKGFCRFTPIGGVNPLYEVGGRVQFADGMVGVVGVDKVESGKGMPGIDKLYIDVGATSRADCPVSVGDAACFLQPFVQIRDHLTSKAMDDRIGCAVLVEVLRSLGESPHDVVFVFSSQEEVGLRGATTAAFGVEPDVGIAVDVTLSPDVPEAKVHMDVKLDGGPAVKVKDGGMLATPWVKDWMIATAERNDIPYQLEVLVGGTTDARAMQTSRSGVPVGCLSIPCRYVHSPSETVSRTDVAQSIQLLLAMLQGPVPGT